MMTKKRKRSQRKVEVNDAACNLFQAGLGARRTNDNQMAKILFGVAEKLWEEGDDSRRAGKARDLYRSF
jgi:hypothetical protein